MLVGLEAAVAKEQKHRSSHSGLLTPRHAAPLRSCYLALSPAGPAWPAGSAEVQSANPRWACATCSVHRNEKQGHHAQEQPVPQKAAWVLLLFSRTNKLACDDLGKGAESS